VFKPLCQDSGQTVSTWSSELFRTKAIGNSRLAPLITENDVCPDPLELPAVIHKVFLYNPEPCSL
jgi:hypothetical protein